MSENLPIFGIEKSNLTDFTTTEKDMKRGVSRFPPSQFRLKQEDIIFTASTASPSTGSKASGLADSEIVDNTFAFTEDFQQNVEIRNKQFQESKNFQEKLEDEDDEDEDEEGEEGGPSKEPSARASMRAGGAMIFSRVKDEKNVKLQDFIIMKMVGKGTFGKVFLVQHMMTRKLYAMKCIRKDIVIDNEQFENIKLEKDILYTIDHPFIVNMDYVFQNEYRIYFLMKFIKGGELFRHLNKVKRFTEDQARFMIAQIAIALGHLHSKNILYRDLKPENILFNEDGYLLLADFGLAKMTNSNELANSFCGTAEYLSPEMIIGNGHDHTVDWWTMGILLYELLVGIPPFFHRNKHRMYFLIKESPVTFPDKAKHGIEVSPLARDLIKKLLDKNKKKRLGAQGDVQEVLAHPFFASISMEKILNKEILPPYKPEISDDLKYFDQKLTCKDDFAESVIDDQHKKLISQN